MQLLELSWGVVNMTTPALQYRILYKILIIAYTALHGQAPSCVNFSSE